MATEITLPDLGENIESGTIVNVKVSVGDQIEVEQTIVEIETGKAIIEIPSSAAGTVTSVDVSVGDDVEIGAVLVTIEAADAAPEEAAPESVQKAQAEVAEPVAKEEPPQPVRSDLVEEREIEAPVSEAPSSPSTSLTIPASPSVRRFAREIGVDLSTVTGTGSGGRISEDDVKAQSRTMAQETVEVGKGAMVSTAQADLPDFSKWGEIRREKMSRLRITVAENMAYAWNVIPHVTQEDRADITELEQWRKKNSAIVEKEGGKLTVTAIALKVAAAALRKFPQFGTSIDMTSNEIIYKDYVHIGVAVDTDRGLVVPVIRDADRKSLVDISVELTALAEKARDGKLGLDEMQGGTFTITNLGGLGTTQFTPIVNWPQVAILGISRGRAQAIWNKDSEAFEPKLILPLSVSYDHRIIDGADASRFLRWIAHAFEEFCLMV